MKIIDLLNRIAKGEEVPRKIKWDEKEFIYGKNRIYINEDDEPLVYDLLPSGENLNDEIKIIEEIEDKEYEDIEELSYAEWNKNEYDLDKELYYIKKINALIKNQKKIIERLDK